MATWTVGIVLVTLIVWTAAGEGGAATGAYSSNDNPIKYVIYSLPVTVWWAYLAINRVVLRLDARAILALAIYLVCALTTMLANAWFEFHAIRDLAIVTGYLLLFILRFEAPTRIADIALGGLAVGMVIETLRGDIGWDVDLNPSMEDLFGLSGSQNPSLFGSHALLESVLAFPIGIVLLYYLCARKRGRAVIAGMLLLMASKRIAFLGVAFAVAFDLASSRRGPPRVARPLALGIVLTLSVVALFSAQLFELSADSLNLKDTSASSVSGGRYEIATWLWDELRSGSLLAWIIGSGPGSADAIVSDNFSLANPHNDWLKLLFDYGVVGFAAMHAVLFLNLARDRLGLMLYVYTATLMMTDNIFIYMFYYPFVVMIMRIVRR
jgi:hypothetical protein